MRTERELEIKKWAEEGGDLRKAYLFVTELLAFVSGLRDTNVSLNRQKETFSEARDKWMKSSDKYQVLHDKAEAKLAHMTQHLKTRYECIGIHKRHVDGNCLHCLGKYLMVEKL